MAHDHHSFALPVPMKDSAAPKRRSEWRALGMLVPYLWEFRVRVSRAIERGTRGISTLLSYMLFSIVPVILEFSLVAVILLTRFDWRFAAVTFVAVALYN